MQQTTIRVFNFALIFALALVTTYFTLGNTDDATINILPGVSTSIPVAALVIISIGIGACIAWLLASLSEKLRAEETKELQETKDRMKELQDEFNKLKFEKNNLSPVTNCPEEESQVDEAA